MHQGFNINFCMAEIRRREPLSARRKEDRIFQKANTEVF